jgi:amino-acid N-acetyltransferase
MTTPTIGLATQEEIDDIERLLRACHLPVAGFRGCLPNVLVAREDGRIVGSAAFETYRSGILLRSVAVDENYRGRGLGEALTEEAFVLACSKGATTAFLLTTTAADFFPRFGFQSVSRDEVPDDVKQSVEFTGACPASAVVMRARLHGHIW